MRLRVPFYKQTNPFNCGQFALKMVSAYFGNNVDLKVLDEKMDAKEGKGISTIKIALAATSLGYKTELYSKYIEFNPENLKLDFYKKYGGKEVQQQSEALVKKAKLAGVKMYQKELSIKEVLKFVKNNSVPIILVDWNIIINKPEKGYQGHFVPIVGYDEKYVYVHNQGFGTSKKFLRIDKNTFDKARKVKGTDEDILVIYNQIQ